jgi:hypothetical protein
MAYQPIQMPQPQGFGAGLAEIIMQARRQSAQEEQARAEMLLRTKQHEAQVTQNYAQQQQQAQQMGIQNSELQMRQQKAQEEIAQKRLGATTQITAALDAGRPDLARQIAKTFGIDMSESPAQSPKDTLMRPSPEAPQAPEFGPQATPEIAKQAGGIRAELASYEPGAQGDQFYRDQAENERTRFETAQRPMEMIGQMPMPPRESTYTVNGEAYDPQQRREAEAKTRDLNTQRFAGAFDGVEGMSKYIPVYQAGVTAGLAPEKAFELMQKRMETDSQAAERAENARLQREQSDVNNRRIAGAMGARVGHDDPFKGRAADRGDEAALDGVTNKVFSNMGFKEVQVSNRKFNDMASALSKPNAALDAVSAGSFVKMAQGGTGVISDSDMEQFWSRIGGVKERSAQWIQNVMNGQIAPEKRAIVGQALRELAGRANQNLGEIKNALSYRLTNSPFADRTPDVIGTYFPADRNRIEEGRRIEAAKERTMAKRKKGAGRDALDAELDGL